MRSLKEVVATLAAVLMMTVTASAQLTYVDADFATNTDPDNAFAGADTSEDNLWGEREFGTNDTVFESSGVGSGSEDSPEIATTIDGLNPGAPYNIYAHFYDVSNDQGQNWPIRAGFTSGDLTLFANGDDGGSDALSATAAGLASDLIFVEDPKFDDGGGRLLYAASLGTATAEASGEVTVYIDDLPSTVGANNRTWYDGVSYELIPEPSSVFLAAAGLALLCCRRTGS